MALIMLLASSALAMSWYASSEAEAEALRGALTEIWPESAALPAAEGGLHVLVGPPLPADPEGAIWWDGRALHLARGEERRSAPGVADPAVQVAMVRGWLAREVQVIEGPAFTAVDLEPLELEPPAPPAPSPLLFALGTGPLLRLDQPRAAWQSSVLIGGQREHLFMGTLISLALGESAVVDGTRYSLLSLDAEFMPGLRLYPRPGAELWLFGTGGSRATLLSAESGDQRLTHGGGLIFGLGLQAQVDQDQGALGLRLRVETTAPDATAELVLDGVAVPVLPGAISLELVRAPGRRP